MSAIGLAEQERRWWPFLRERLRVPGHLMAMMRGVLGDAEVAAVVAVTPEGVVRPIAVLATAPPIADEIRLTDGPRADGPRGDGVARAGLRPAKIGDYDVEVLVADGPDGRAAPVAVLATPWIDQHLLLYARTLWHRRRPRPG